MGKDSVEPFLKYPGTCSFVLCLTSNPSAEDFQLQSLASGEKLYERVAKTAPGWAKNMAGEIGLVVGATKAEYVKSLRTLAPTTAFLVPGVGAQGGDLAAVLKEGRTQDGAGILVNVSRSILYASSGNDYPEAARAEAQKLVGEMKAYF
jgi:orotidine-5'-phosphate decarboxylase